MYYNHNNNIKYIGSIIKCVGFEPIYYDINLNVVSSMLAFNDFDYIYVSMYC